MRLFYLKKLDFKQLLQTYENHIIPSPACYISGIQRNCYSQNARVSIQNARLRVGQVLEQIESQTEYLFVYNKQNVDVHRTVDIHASNQTVSKVLDQMFKGTDIKYVMEGKNIVLTKTAGVLRIRQTLCRKWLL